MTPRDASASGPTVEEEAREGPSDLHGLPTTVRTLGETSFDDWGSGLPVPPPVDAEASTWEGAPTLAPEPAEADAAPSDSEVQPAPEPAESVVEPAPEPVEAVSGEARETVDDPRIPEGKDAFKIGEVSRIVGVKPYVLRYWESELSIIAPEKTSTRQRRYRREDVALLLQVRRLRHEEKLSVARIRVLLGRQSDPAHTGPLVDPTSRLAGAIEPSAGSAQRPQNRAAIIRELDEMRQAVMALLEAVED